MSRSKKLIRSIASFTGLLFPGLILGLYLLLWHAAPEKTVLAVRSSLHIFSGILPPLCLVFLLMAGMDLFLKGPRATGWLGRGAGVKQKIFAAAAGILSAGPIYAWYPMLKDLREKGTEPSLIAIFLINRAVKPPLLPVMVSFFGWVYVLFLTLLIVAGSLAVGLIVGRIPDSPADPRRSGGE